VALGTKKLAETASPVFEEVTVHITTAIPLAATASCRCPTVSVAVAILAGVDQTPAPASYREYMMSGVVVDPWNQTEKTLPCWSIPTGVWPAPLTAEWLPSLTSTGALQAPLAYWLA